MADQVEVTLYDIPTKAPKFCWSFNPWKEWVEYPDLAPTLKALNVPLNPDGDAEYTSPTVVFHSDNTAVMNTNNIALELEKRFPQNPVPFDTPSREKVSQKLREVFLKIRPELLPRVPRMLLAERSKEYFERTRSQWFPPSLYEWEKENAGQKCWTEAEPAIRELGALYHEDGSGPFLEGNKGRQTCGDTERGKRLIDSSDIRRLPSGEHFGVHQGLE
ncbi:MAG: hypothetical protein M1821_000507 [Bathelium mastoideum]|nr:MAG: hypothetical protein M1821_000507 [Bathelium mastoideum]